MRNRYVYWIVLLILFIGAIWLRTYKFSTYTFFWGDQARDLLVADRMIRDHVIPLVGPQLTVQGWHSPPTYYYLLTLFLLIGKTPQGTASFFVVLDLITLALIVMLANSLVDRRMGLIVGALYAVSYTMISHARHMWQPYPMQVFLVTSLLLLQKGLTHKRTILVLLSALFYAIATSIYPAPILLLPFMTVHLYRYFSGTKHMSVQTAIVATASMLLGCGILIGLPQLLYEANHGFPMVSAMTSSVGLATGTTVFHNLWQNSLGIFLSIASLSWAYDHIRHISVYIVIILFCAASFCMWYRSQRKADVYRKSFSFLNLPSLFVGFMLLLLFRDMYTYAQPYHRLFGFLPFFFLFFGLLIHYTFSYQSTLYRGIVIGLFLFYLFVNSMTIYDSLIRPNTSAQSSHIQMAQRIAAHIMTAAKERGIPQQEYSVVSFPPDDYWTSFVIPVQYFLHVRYQRPVVFGSDGNSIETEQPNRAVVFLVCANEEMKRLRADCFQEFSALMSPQYAYLSEQTFSSTTAVFTFVRRSEEVVQ